MPPPVYTSAQSPDTLPLTGYSVDQLCSYILRKLGQNVFVVELERQQVLDSIQDALAEYSQWRPRIGYGGLQLQGGVFEYLQGVDLGYGVTKVDFINPTQAPADLYWLTNLVNPAPVLNSRMDEYDVFLRWYKTWGRVTSVYPDWIYDTGCKVLYIYNASPIYHCGVQFMDVWRDTTKLDAFGAKWVKDFSYETARYSYSDIMSKYSGAIPGPVRDLQFDPNKRGEAQNRIDKLMEQLKGSRITPGIMQD